MSELERCIQFLREAALRCAPRTEESPFGLALLHDELPRVWSLNYLLAERNLESATAPLLAAEADRVLGAAGLGHRKLEVHDSRAGNRLDAGFRELGWQVECDVVMVARRPADANAGNPTAKEVGAPDLEDVWARGYRSQPSGREEETVRQLLRARSDVLVNALGARFFAARADGTIASYCDLYTGGGVGQIENVMTLEPYRNRGLARAVVSSALHASENAGNTLTFLLADRDDWPKELYRKLGFEEIGSIYEFRRSMA